MPNCCENNWKIFASNLTKEQFKQLKRDLFSVITIDNEKQYICIDFENPWGPAESYLHKLKEKYPDVEYDWIFFF